MSEEEEEAIEQLKSWREFIIKNKEKVNKANDIEFYLRTVLNLIQKQQEEKQQLERKYKGLQDKIREILINYEHTPADDPYTTTAFFADIKKLVEVRNDANS